MADLVLRLLDLNRFHHMVDIFNQLRTTPTLSTLTKSADRKTIGSGGMLNTF